MSEWGGTALQNTTFETDQPLMLRSISHFSFSWDLQNQTSTIYKVSFVHTKSNYRTIHDNFIYFIVFHDWCSFYTLLSFTCLCIPRNIIIIWIYWGSSCFSPIFLFMFYWILYQFTNEKKKYRKSYHAESSIFQ